MNALSAMKTVSFVLAGAIVLFLAVGAAMDNHWEVAHSYTAPPGTDVARVFDNVAHLASWPKWNPASDAACKVSEKSIDCTDGSITIVSADVDKGVFFDEKHDIETISHGSITWQKTDAGVVITWRDEGPLPPVFGAWMRGKIEKNIELHMDEALRRLASL